mmetsp:Transcript_16038/g.23784  ORF Transcript_16038/g.23784 Transcript_16038/m.23784 type:complete len:82 (-) Transcript_16038:35-280(-)
MFHTKPLAMHHKCTLSYKLFVDTIDFYAMKTVSNTSSQMICISTIGHDTNKTVSNTLQINCKLHQHKSVLHANKTVSNENR